MVEEIEAVENIRGVNGGVAVGAEVTDPLHRHHVVRKVRGLLPVQLNTVMQGQRHPRPLADHVAPDSKMREQDFKYRANAAGARIKIVPKEPEGRPGGVGYVGRTLARYFEERRRVTKIPRQEGDVVDGALD